MNITLLVDQWFLPSSILYLLHNQELTCSLPSPLPPAIQSHPWQLHIRATGHLSLLLKFSLLSRECPTAPLLVNSFSPKCNALRHKMTKCSRSMCQGWVIFQWAQFQWWWIRSTNPDLFMYSCPVFLPCAHVLPLNLLSTPVQPTTPCSGINLHPYPILLSEHSS